MATVNKDFKIKSGLIVEGTTATVNGYDVLTKKQADQDFIVDIIGGETLVKSVSNEFDVSVGGELSIDRATVDAYYDAAGAAATAEQNAKDYADDLAPNYDAAGSASAAQTAAQGYADGLAVNYDAAGAAATAQSNAEDYADGLASNYDAAGAAAQALSDANDYTDTAVGNLVGAAPEVLNTLEELATALQENPDIISDLQDIAAGKQDTLTAGSNIDITGSTISVTGLDSADISDFNTAALSATSAAYDAAGAAATAEQNAKDYADALTTDDVAEGTTQYFTDARAKSSAADLLTGASLTNITITGTGAGLTITAEDGIAGKTTDDLSEGSTNLYFTDARAVGAIDNANITPNQIDINWARTETATWTAIPTASQAVCHQAGGNYGTIKYLVRVVATIGGTRHSHATEVLATVDGSNGVAVVEYGTIYTSAEPMATVTVLWNGLSNCYELNVTTANNNSEVMVAASALATID